MSIVDRREIQFTAEAVRRVICASPQGARAIGLPRGRPTGIQFMPSSGLVRLVYSDGAGARETTISVQLLGALLVSYCLHSGIPMPLLSRKALRIDENFASLLFSTSYTADESPTATLQFEEPGSITDHIAELPE